MATIQLALDNLSLADLLQGMLRRSTEIPVRRVDQPDPDDDGVMVLDMAHFSRVAPTITHPERVVLIASKDASDFDDAWQAGVSSVVLDRDPLSTVVLAILSACLRREPQAGGVPDKQRHATRIPNKETRR
jgi:hypothetical protein